MTNIPLEIPPGFALSSSPNGVKGRFTGGDKVRFKAKFPEKWAGWVLYIANTVLGVARGMVSWTNTFGDINVAIGTNLKLYAIVGDSSFDDITPIRTTVTLGNNPFATQSGQTLITVTHNSHLVSQNDFVTYSGATAVAGLTLSGEYEIVDVLDNNTYTFNAASPANATTSGGGAAVSAAYQINTGSDGTVYGLGYGAGQYNVSTYGTPRATGIPIEGRVWSISGYGNDLLASPLNGGLYFWDNITPRAVVVANAPTSMRAMFVTPERFVFALGTTTKMTVAWPDVNDFTDWTPSPTNTANIRKLQSGNQLMNGAGLTDGISLVWTDTSLYLFQKITTDEIYSSRLLGDNVGLIGPLAFVIVAGVAFWMAPQGFYMFGGSILQINNWQDVQTFVYADMDPAQVAKCWGFYDQPNNQVRFHYCSNGALTPDKYVDVELTDWVWTTGTFDGTTGCRHRPQEASSLFVTAAGGIYSFNVGLDAAGVAIHFSLQYGLYSLNRGENNVDIFNLWPDVQRQVGNLTYTCETKDYSDDALTLDTLVLTVAPHAGKVEARCCGRHWTMKVESNQLGGDVRLGIPMLEIEDSGMRE